MAIGVEKYEPEKRAGILGMLDQIERDVEAMDAELRALGEQLQPVTIQEPSRQGGVDKEHEPIRSSVGSRLATLSRTVCGITRSIRDLQASIEL